MHYRNRLQTGQSRNRITYCLIHEQRQPSFTEYSWTNFFPPNAALNCVIIILATEEGMGTIACNKLNVTRSGKTGLIRTSIDIHFLPVRESCTHALHRNYKYLIIDGQVCFYWRLFTDAVEPPGCISQPWGALIGLNGGTRLLLTAAMAHLVDCTSAGPILTAQHCCLSPNGCFSPPSASHPPPPPPTPLPPAHPL